VKPATTGLAINVSSWLKAPVLISLMENESQKVQNNLRRQHGGDAAQYVRIQSPVWASCRVLLLRHSF